MGSVARGPGAHFFFPHCPRSREGKIAPMLFWPSPLTEAKGGLAQTFTELVSRPRRPPKKVIVKLSIGASGRLSKKARKPPCLEGPISPSTTMWIEPECKSETRSGKRCAEERR